MKIEVAVEVMPSFDMGSEKYQKETLVETSKQKVQWRKCEA